MGTILGNPAIVGGGARLNIDYGATPPEDTSKLWIPLAEKPVNVDVDITVPFGDEFIVLDGTYTETLAYASGDVIDGKLYITAGFTNRSGSDPLGHIYVYDPVTKVMSDTGDSLPARFRDAASIAANGSLYVFGGYGFNEDGSAINNKNTIYKYTPATHTVVALSPMSFYLADMSICKYDNKIYLIGGLSIGSGSVSGQISYLDLTDDSFTNLGTSYVYRWGTAVGAWKNNLYIIGGRDSSEYYKSIIKFNLQTKTKSTVANQNLDLETYTSAYAQFGQYIYMFGGTIENPLGAQGSTPQRYIYRFDCETEEITRIDALMPSTMGWRWCGSDGNVDYVFGIDGSSQNVIYKFTVKSPLAENNLLIQHDYYSGDRRWKAVNGKKAQISVYPINAYLGNAEGYAEKVTARLYDATAQVWKSLDGVSYSTDAAAAAATQAAEIAELKAALQILGVETDEKEGTANAE